MGQPEQSRIGWRAREFVYGKEGRRSHRDDVRKWPVHLGHLCGGGTMANLEALCLKQPSDQEWSLLPGSGAIRHARPYFEVLGPPFEAISDHHVANTDPLIALRDSKVGAQGCRHGGGHACNKSPLGGRWDPLER